MHACARYSCLTLRYSNRSHICAAGESTPLRYATDFQLARRKRRLLLAVLLKARSTLLNKQVRKIVRVAVSRYIQGDNFLAIRRR